MRQNRFHSNEFLHAHNSSNGKARQGRIIYRTYPSAITGSRDYMNYEYGTTVYAEVGANETADEHIQLIWLAGFVIGANFFGARTPNEPSYRRVKYLPIAIGSSRYLSARAMSKFFEGYGGSGS